MPRPTARVLAMLEALQGGGTHSVRSLSAALGVDERTVRRYLGHLLDLDVPVETIRGRHGGYRLAPGYRMPPLMLTEEEATAAVLALAAAAQRWPGTAAADAALAKLRRAMPRELGSRIDALLTSVSFAGGGDAVDLAPTRLLLLIAEAARDRHPVGIRYADRTGRRSTRVLLPYGIVARAGRWYLAAADSISGEVRTFRLDRVSAPRILGGTFDVPAQVDPIRAVLDGLAATPWAHEVAFRVAATPEWIRRWFPEGMARLEPLDDGRIRVVLRAERLEWIPGVIAALDRPVEIERPERLRELVRAVGRRLAAVV